MNKKIMHINYAEMGFNSFGTRSVDDICRFAAETGFDGIEFRGGRHIPLQYADRPFTEYVSDIAAAKKKYGLSEILFGIGIDECSNPDKEVREKSIAETIEKAKIVNDLCGTTLCNTFGKTTVSTLASAPRASYEFHGSFAATAEDWELTADSFRKLGDAAEKLGMKFAYETHMNYIHDLPAATMKLVNMVDSPAIGVNMDYGNTVYFPAPPSVVETIDMYGDKLFYTHLKNSSAVPGSGLRMATALGDGSIDHREYLAKLKEVGFTGPIGIEAPRGGDRYWFAECDLAYFNKVYASL